MFWQHYNELDSYRKLDIKIKSQGLFSTTLIIFFQAPLFSIGSDFNITPQNWEYGNSILKCFHANSDTLKSFQNFVRDYMICQK